MAIGKPLWPVDTVRETFFSYFEKNQHLQLSSTPVIPINDPKVPYLHTCLNRFSGTLTGRGKSRSCFSLRCIIVGGDDADVIRRYRNSSSYHRFTEILGSWSFGDYFKEEAIRLTFGLLTEEYRLPQSRIHAKYFSGDTSLGLSSDNESKNTLQKYVAKDRIVPSMSKAEFWMSGETGPCGPSIGFLFDCSDIQDVAGSVMNTTDDKLIEICRLVFVEFNMQAEGILGPLQAKHVLTGINLECLAGILQQKSHYDLDVCTDILDVICTCGHQDIKDYSGKIGAADTDGVDTAYRLLADHMRMIAVTNAPGSQLGLGNEGREYFLKCADKQAAQYGHEVLKTRENFYEVMVYTILVTEDYLCPELEGYRIKDKIVEDEVMIYDKTMAELRDQELPFDMGGKNEKKKDVTPVVWYATRVIKFLGRHTCIILKNKDTCCSLVPLCNVLLLGAKITLNLDIKKVSEGHLIYLVQSYLLYGTTKMQLEQNLELSEFNKQVLGLLPKLPGSLYFDLTFVSSCGFEQTSETALFGFLGVPLHHGWLVDPQDVKLGSSIPKSSYYTLSYNVTVYEAMLSGTNSGPQVHGGLEDDTFYSALALSITGSEELGSISHAMMLAFLRGPQLTPFGFSSLRDDLIARQPTILFWNEKLITIVKVKDQIYVLLNDLSLLSTETDAVWERLTEENGDGLFVNCNFVPTDSEIQSILPLTKKERKKRNKRNKRVLKENEEDRREDIEGDNNGDRDNEKDDENIEEKANISGMHVELDISPIDFLGLSTHRIHQINDGPCALIAICNVLLLTGRLHFEPQQHVVSIEELLNIVFTFLEESVKMQALSSEIQKSIRDVAKTLATGFDVNVVFTRTDGFTETLEWFLVDCLNVNLRHGWIAAADLLSGPEDSFESLTLVANDYANAEAIKEFLRGPQLTPIGLASLQEDLVENTPCILYWNHHYSTIVKINGRLLSLVTDSNYLTNNFVWQTLSEVSGNGSYLDSSLRPIYTGLDAAPSRDNLHCSYLVPKTCTQRSMRPYQEEDPQINPETSEIPLHDFVLIPGNQFSEMKTIFADGTSLDIADTTKTGRVLGLDLLEELFFSHDAGLSWDGKFDLMTIFVIDGVHVEIRAPYCKKFCEEAKLNDFLSYIFRIMELYRIKGIGLPAFFTQLVRKLSHPPRRPKGSKGSNTRQLEGFQRRLQCYWDCVLTTLALRSSLARAGLYAGIHRIRRFAPAEVRRTLRLVLNSYYFKDDWRLPIADDEGHPVLKKVLRYIPDILDGSNETAKEGEAEDRKFGRYVPDVGSLSIFPRQVNEHGKSEEEEERERQQGVEEEPLNKLSELDLLTSHYLEDRLPTILEALLCSDHMTAELWKWLEEVLEDYIRREVLDRGTWYLRRRVSGDHGRETWNIRRHVRQGRAHSHGHRGRGRARDFG